MKHVQLIRVRVAKKTVEAENTVSFDLRAADGSNLPRFSAGAHIDVHVKPGVVRQYSLCNHPSENWRYLICVLRDPGSRGGSVGMHDGIFEGDLLQISEPRNHFELVHSERSLLLAGGIGVTPLLCMAEQLAQSGSDFEMHYCNRSLERTAFMARIAASPFSDKVHFHFDDGEARQKLDLPALLDSAAPDMHTYVCGPAGFIKWVTATAASHSLSADRLHTEYFGAPVTGISADRAFNVKIASTGQVIPILPNQPVTTVLAQCGIIIPISCEQGVCGTCLTRVLGGEPEHRDLFQTDDEKARNDQFTPCCSRSRSLQLVLDL